MGIHLLIWDYLSLLIDEGLDLNPGMIMINVYIGNDITYTTQYKKSQPFIL